MTIKVTITFQEKRVWSGYFNNYPTQEELLACIPNHNRGNFSIRNFVELVDFKCWIFHYFPRLGDTMAPREIEKISQFVRVCDLPFGTLEMKELPVQACEGFDPFSTDTRIKVGKQIASTPR